MNNLIIAIANRLPIGETRNQFFVRCKAAKDSGKLPQLLAKFEERLKVLPLRPTKSNQPTRDYTELEATHVYDDGIQGACPLCSHVDKFTICPECYFVRGRFIPTNMLLSKSGT